MVKNPAASAGDAIDVGGDDALEAEMAICSSTLAWKIPWTEEPGGLQSMSSQKSWIQQRLSAEQKLFPETHVIVMDWQSTDHPRTGDCSVAPHAGSPVSYKEHPLISTVPNMGWIHAFRAGRAVSEL